MMKKGLLFVFALCINMTASAQSNMEVTINTAGIWMGILDDNLTKLREKGEFDNIFFEFGEDGNLTVSRYRGAMTDLKKTVEQYQYQFDKDKLTVSADGKTKNITYSLEYHSFHQSKSMILFFWKEIEKELHLTCGETAIKMKKDFDDMLDE